MLLSVAWNKITDSSCDKKMIWNELVLAVFEALSRNCCEGTDVYRDKLWSLGRISYLIHPVYDALI